MHLVLQTKQNKMNKLEQIIYMYEIQKNHFYKTLPLFINKRSNIFHKTEEKTHSYLKCHKNG